MHFIFYGSAASLKGTAAPKIRDTFYGLFLISRLCHFGGLKTYTLEQLQNPLLLKSGI